MKDLVEELKDKIQNSEKHISELIIDIKTEECEELIIKHCKDVVKTAERIKQEKEEMIKLIKKVMFIGDENLGE